MAGSAQRSGVRACGVAGRGGAHASRLGGKGGRGGVRAALAAAALLAVAACAEVALIDDARVGAPPLCGPGVDLGRVVVVPRADWIEPGPGALRVNPQVRGRPFQPPAARDAMALAAIDTAFAELPCGRVVARTDFDAVPDVLADTRVDVSLRRLGARIAPALSSGWTSETEADFTLTARDLRGGATLLQVDRRRIEGGGLQIRPAELAGEEFTAALRELIGGR